MDILNKIIIVQNVLVHVKLVMQLIDAFHVQLVVIYLEIHVEHIALLGPLYSQMVHVNALSIITFLIIKDPLKGNSVRSAIRYA